MKSETTFRTIFKKFVSYYAPYKKLFYFDLVCAVFISLIDLAFPQLLRAFSSTLFTESADKILAALGWVAVLMIGMALVSYACQYFVTYWGHIMGARMETDMRQDLFDQYQRLSFSYYDRNNTGEMMSKLVSDLFDISELAHHGPENLLISVLKIAGSFTLLALINVKMTLILLVITVVMVAYSMYMNRRMGAAFTDNRKKIAGVNSRLQDTLAGIRVVKSFTNEGVEQDKFAQSNHEFLHSKSGSYRAMANFTAVSAFFKGLLYATVLISGGYFVAKGELAIPDLAVYALYIGIFMSPLELLINFAEQFQKGYAGFKRLFEVLIEEPSIVDKKDAPTLGMAEDHDESHSEDPVHGAGHVRGEILYNDVRFSYDEECEIIRGLTLHIEAGKTVALVGPSGGGKTTLCSLLPRFYDVTHGSVSIDGQDVRDVTIKSLRDAVGIVQQDVYLFSGSIRENIAYGRHGASEEEIVQAARDASIHDFIMSLDDGYDTFVGERGARLSGGQKQRIAIARVFLKDPAILILDEATSALDNESEQYIQGSLERLAAGRSTLIIAHRLSTIRRADEIVVMSSGQIRERGTHRELLAEDGLYAKYYQMQFEGLD